MAIKNRILFWWLAAMLTPVAFVGQQEAKHCSGSLTGLYLGSWDSQKETEFAFVISPNGQPIPPKANDPDAPIKPGFYVGQQRFDFVSTRFSSKVLTFHTVAIDGRTFFFSGRFGCEAVDVIPEVPYVEGELTEMKNAQVVRKKNIHFSHAVVF